jgi:hypothetical protein
MAPTAADCSTARRLSWLFRRFSHGKHPLSEIGSANKKGVLTLHWLLISCVQVGTPLSGVAGSARRWVAPVNDHHWSHLDISNERAKQICPAVDAESLVNCNQIDSALAIYFEG